MELHAENKVYSHKRISEFHSKNHRYFHTENTLRAQTQAQAKIIESRRIIAKSDNGSMSQC